MKYDYHIIVIGAGSGGLVVASGAASIGAKVALIEGHKMGGDCLNYGCVPSKSFLKGAHLAADLNHAKKFGLDVSLNHVDVAQLMNRVSDVIKEIEPHDSKERYEGLGVDVIEGYGSLKDEHTVMIGNRTITGKNIVIATGSEAFIPPIKGLDTVDYYTNMNIFDLKEQPKKLIVLGGGPIGLELGQGFRHLGSEVTIIDRSEEVFSKDDPEVGPILHDVFINEGIQLKLGASIQEVKSINDEIEVIFEQDGQSKSVKGDALLVSLGRSPNTKNLGLENVNIEVNNRGYIVTNKKLQTNIKNIYACGDVTGPFQFTHMAGYQAGIVIRNTIFKLGAKVDYSFVPWTTYTKPEVSHVGLTEVMAKKENKYATHYTVDINALDRAKADEDRKGFLKLIVDKKGRLIGATLVGEKAGEQMPIAALAIKNKMKLSGFMNIIFSYPTEAEIFKFAALESLKSGFKPWQKNLVKKIFLR